MSEDEAPDRVDGDRPSGLAAWERIVAGILGLGGVGVGGTGIFLSENQAGTTAILLIGAVFLLIAIQGTPITKAGKDSVELERRARARALTQEATNRLNDDDASGASKLAAAARAVDPGLSADPAFGWVEAEIYEEQVFSAVARCMEKVAESGEFPGDISIGNGTLLDYLRAGFRPDVLVTFRGALHRTLPVEAKNYKTRIIPNALVEQLLNKMQASGARIGLLVSNGGIGAGAYERLRSTSAADGPFLRFVEWANETDDAALLNAIVEVLRWADQAGIDPA